MARGVRGPGRRALEWLIFEEEYYRAGAPTRVGQNGIFLLAPTLFEFGTPEQQARFLPSMASGEKIWCQGWSEPDAGSDLAAIRSRADAARRAPSGTGTWVLNGQKTWCCRGAFADWIFGLFRTDPEAQRHRGLTYFLVPMDARDHGPAHRPARRRDGVRRGLLRGRRRPRRPGARDREPGLVGGHGHGRLRTGPLAAEPGPLHRGGGEPGRPLPPSGGLPTRSAPAGWPTTWPGP